MIEIQKNIEEIRKQKGIKQTTIAEILGVGQSAYSNYISRNSDIKFSLLEKIAEILHVSVIDIITYPEVYVKGQKRCEGCEERDKTIQNLNRYIEVLERKLNNRK